MDSTNDSITSQRPFSTRFGLRLVAIIAGCVAAVLVAFLIMLPTMLLGIRLGPGLGSTAWCIGFFVGYQVYRYFCKLFKLKIRNRGEEEQFEKENNEVTNSASSLYVEGNGQIIDTDVILEDVVLTEDDNAVELASETTEAIEKVTTLSSDGASTFSEDDNMSETETIIGLQDATHLEDTMGTADQKDIEEEVTNNPKKASLLTSDKEPILTADTNESNMKRQNTKHRNNLPKWLKIIIIAFVVIASLCVVYLLSSFIYTNIIYPKQAKANDEQLVQLAKDNPSKALEIAQELFKRDEEHHQSDYYNFITGRHGTCDFDHIKAGEDAINIYCQYCIDSAMHNISDAESIAIGLFHKSNGYIESDFINAGVKILKYAAENGNVDAQKSLGSYYYGSDFNKNWGGETIDGKEIDERKAAYWWAQAAEQGHTTAMGNLGTCYIQGIGVNKNEAKGVELIQNAANQGDAFFQCLLGDHYRDGVKMQIGSHKKLKPGYSPYLYNKYDTYAWEDVPEYEIILPKDIEQAKYWWRLAAENGNETAKERLQQIYD